MKQPDASTIVSSRVVSDDSGVKITAVAVSPQTRAALNTGRAHIPQGSRDSKESASAEGPAANTSPRAG